MNGQFERDYRDALDGLRFSGEAKERMMKNLMEQQERKPEKRRGVRPLRAALIAAAACLALVGTAGAAVAVARQADIHFFDDWAEYLEAQRAKSEADGVDYGILGGVADLDYDELGHTDMESWWNGEEEAQGREYTVITETEGILGGVVQADAVVQTLVDETAGKAEDGWTAKRVFRYEVDGQTYLSTKYRADALSGYDGLWNSWDTSWLEGHYTSMPDNTGFESIELDGNPYRMNINGEFRGEGDTAFNLGYSWDSTITWGDEYLPSALYDYTELYTTVDGVTAAISMNASHSGKTLFWVSLYSGHGSFNMFGTQVELDDLHAILDSLNLSVLLDYTPE